MLTTIVLSAFLAALDTDATPAPLPQNCAPAIGFSGTICVPADKRERRPGILLLGGWEGGDSAAELAPAFANAGYVAASVAYFQAPGTPPALQNVPVEMVGTALAAFARRDDVDAERLAIFGMSKGGELALLAATTYPQIHAVIADVASPFAWEGIPVGIQTHESSWSAAGKPLPYVPFTDAMNQIGVVAFKTKTPIRTRAGYDDASKNDAAVERAFFPLEKIDGPVLFLAAGDDQFWDSLGQAQLGLAYLQRKHHAFADRLRSFPSAGNFFMLATADRPLVSLPFVGDMTLGFGGTASGNVAARAAAMPLAIEFLSAALAERRTP